ncbi:MAG TPA: hypothetical protein VJV05_15350, partial [Pyrinomonadaceae bacterium]|nr:hypothetical protein [Pyrinomonadaceae bacterium]
TLNGRGRSGRVRRNTITPIDTITNANKVPILTNCPSAESTPNMDLHAIGKLIMKKENHWQG